MVKFLGQENAREALRVCWVGKGGIPGQMATMVIILAARLVEFHCLIVMGVRVSHVEIMDDVDMDLAAG